MPEASTLSQETHSPGALQHVDLKKVLLRRGTRTLDSFIRQTWNQHAAPSTSHTESQKNGTRPRAPAPAPTPNSPLGGLQLRPPTSPTRPQKL